MTEKTDAHLPPQRRTAGALLIAGPAIFLLGEFVAAAAWTDPAYSYTHHFISNLGVHGPSTLFGQYMYSPLAWVMNTGFFLFGITILAGVATLRDLSGGRRWATLVPATMLAVGGVLLALFPGSGEALENGTGEFHSMGAFAGFIGANTLAVVLGRRRRRIGLSPRMGAALIAVGVIGLLSMTLYLAMILTAGDTPVGIIGLIERGAVHPFLIGVICAGASLWQRQTVNAPTARSITAGQAA
ncbi:DUF998 domain-containing protein [Streptomyces shenzhenensis]|uniref:DUF998 domain-containing protein n=1 Tax=Streptomyces shenzhenensis TaxID=943815 RepID=UPI00340F623D